MNNPVDQLRAQLATIPTEMHVDVLIQQWEQAQDEIQFWRNEHQKQLSAAGLVSIDLRRMERSVTRLQFELAAANTVNQQRMNLNVADTEGAKRGPGAGAGEHADSDAGVVDDAASTGVVGPAAGGGDPIGTEQAGGSDHLHDAVVDDGHAVAAEPAAGDE